MPQNYTQYMSVLGTAGAIDTSGPLPSFTIRTRGGDVVKATISEATYFAALQNLDRLDRDRIPDPAVDPIQKDTSPLAEKLKKYVVPGRLIAAEGIYQAHGGREWFDAKAVYVLYSHLNMLMFEHTHWWITQIAAMGDKWLNDLFHDKRNYQIDDFVALYQTNLNILGLPSDDNIQEMATLSRFIYGLSSAYLMTGDIRFYLAAKAGVEFQRDAFRSLSADGRFCFWAFGRRRGKYGTKLIIPSENPDDLGTIPLYEQIYALAGMTQFYRISADWEVLHDIRRTIASFNQFYPRPAGRQLLLAHRLCHVQPPQSEPRPESIPEELELDRRPPARLPRQPRAGPRPAPHRPRGRPPRVPRPVHQDGRDHLQPDRGQVLGREREHPLRQ